jgi:hypothetical protein
MHTRAMHAIRAFHHLTPATAQAPAPHNHAGHEGHEGDGDGDEEMAYYIYNHLEFTVLLHRADASTMASPSLGAAAAAASDGAPPGALRRAIGSSSAGKSSGGADDPGWLVVGFEVLPCSVAQEALSGLPPYTPEADRIAAAPDTAAMLAAPAACAASTTPGARVAAGEVLSFTYSVRFVESPIAWVNRWDAYLDMGTNDEDVHWVRPAMRGVVVLFACDARADAGIVSLSRFSFSFFCAQFSIMNSLVLVIALGGAWHALCAQTIDASSSECVI